MKALTIFFAISCVILIFSIINLSVGPVINKRLNYSKDYELLNCEKLVNDYNDYKKKHPDMSEQTKNEKESEIRECRNRKAMQNMEYTSFIFNIFIGFVGVLLGLFGLQKELIPKTGFIGIGCGVVGFILTLVYVIYNGVVYTNYFDERIFKVDGDGAFAEYNEKMGVYECFYYKKNETYAIYAKYCDLIKSQYNYNYDLINSFEYDEEKIGCSDRASPSTCQDNEYIKGPYKYKTNYLCSKLYYTGSFDKKYFANYNLSARFLTVLLLSIIIDLCYCGLIFFGFMLSKE